jgi:hypothetical protein
MLFSVFGVWGCKIQDFLTQKENLSGISRKGFRDSIGPERSKLQTREIQVRVPHILQVCRYLIVGRTFLFGGGHTAGHPPSADSHPQFPGLVPDAFHREPIGE